MRTLCVTSLAAALPMLVPAAFGGVTSDVAADGKVTIDGRKPGVMEREIDFAADAGLDYWAILEFDEGGWLCPTRGADGKPDTMRIEALKAALAE